MRLTFTKTSFDESNCLTEQLGGIGHIETVGGVVE